MALFDNYRLSNSNLVEQYQGAPIQEMLQVGTQLQGQYDTARAQDDYLAQQAQYASVHPKDVEGFQKILNPYRERISQRAQSGNYEDMVRATALDAQGFVRDYAPFAANQKARSDYQASLEKQAKDYNLTPEIMQGLMAESEARTPGMTVNPITREVQGQFQGLQAAKNINIPEWVDERIKGIIANETGSSVTSIGQIGQDPEGLYYLTQSGTKKYVDAGRVQNVLRSAINSDPELQASIQQIGRVRTVGMEQITPDVVAGVDPNEAARIQAIADQRQVPFGQVYREEQQSRVANNLVSNLETYGLNKGVYEQRTSQQSIGSETAASQRVRADQEMNNFGIPIVVPNEGTALESPAQVSNAISEGSRGLAQMGEAFSVKMRERGIAKSGNRYITADGLDVTDDVMSSISMMNQERKRVEDIAKLDRESRAQAGYRMTPDLERRAQEAYDNAYAETGTNFGRIATGANSEAQRRSIAQAEYNKVLENTPAYKEYRNVLATKSKNSSQFVTVLPFQSKSDNAQIERLVNNLSSSDFDSSLLAPEYVGSRRGGQPFDEDDYEAIRGDIKFAGTHTDSRGQQKFIFTATDPKTKENIQFQLSNIVSRKPVPALTGEGSQFVAQQTLRTANANATKSAEVPLVGGSVELRMPDGYDNRYRMILKANGSNPIETLLPNEGAMSKALVDLIQKHGTK